MRVMLIILLFLPIGLFAQWPVKSKAKIKLVITYGFNPEQNISPNNTEHWIARNVFRFDTAGRATWFFLAGRSDKPQDTIFFTYDKEGRELKSGSSNYSYSYNQQNNLVVKDLNKKNAPIFKIIDKKNGADTIFNNGDASILVIKYNADKTVINRTWFNKKRVVQNRSIEIHDSQDRIIDEIEIKDGVRQNRRTFKYEKYGYTVVDSGKMYDNFSPGNRKYNITSTYKYETLDKYDNPLIISVLLNGKYVVDRKNEYEYY
ncbi:MAG: hypothetical protein JWR50_18 [Mucilaginibacter sp.]|nr:hypothetical protein [Mucilaginibacter sp.]